ncbi:prolyl 4-hydroxylase 10 [Gracilaria domingensis]|nr:prolyl 4-hydroxylase 10 [Gracilaria domingensis]
MKAANHGYILFISAACLLGAAVFLITNPRFGHPYIDPVQPYIDRIRSRLDLPLSAPSSEDVSDPSQTRLVLPDGRISSPVWDMPRHLMENNFSSISKTIPGAKDNILTEEEIDMVIEKATPIFTKSLVVGPGGKTMEDKTRTSDTAWLFHTADESIASIVQKVTSLAGFSMHHAEAMGINRYRGGQFFNPHFDFLQEGQMDGMPEFKGCQRASTVLIYLSDVEEGGETVFARDGHMDGNFRFDETNPDHLIVKPKRGRVLIWYDMHPYTESVDPRTLHGGSPVISGTKIAATIFVRNCSRQVPQPAESAKTEL